MVGREISKAQLIALLRLRQGSRTVTELADDIGVTLAYMSKVLRGEMSIGPKILTPLGYVAVRKTVYRKVA